jgi:broad specificity phosphatase PhoE
VVVGSGKIIDPPRIAQLFISPLIRARRTYELLFDETIRRDFEGKVEITEDIREWDYGLYEGILPSQARTGRKERGLDKEKPWDIWVDGCEGGESPAEIKTRLDRVIAKIREIQGPYMKRKEPSDVVIIAHGQILRAFTKRVRIIRFLKFFVPFF